MDSWTIRSVVTWASQDFAARGFGSPRLDAELIVAKALGIDRVGVYLDLDRPLRKEELTEIRALIERRRACEPVAYLRGVREFFGRDFEVDPSVLIPRPETETLVELALARLEHGPAPMLDLCTGSGAIAVCVAAERPDLSLRATDISEAALRVAARNAERHGVHERIAFSSGDLFGALTPTETFGLITANPPYIADTERSSLARDVVGYEPEVALFGGTDGLDVVRRIANEAAAFLAPGGRVLIEIGASQGAAAYSAFASLSVWTAVRLHPDAAGRDRVIEAEIRAT